MAGSSTVTGQLTSMLNRFSFLRTGNVIMVDPFYATIQFDLVGTDATESMQIRAAYVKQSKPQIGDVVAVMRQGASWQVLGTSSVSGGNSVQNPSFEEYGVGQQPTGWTLYAVSGVPRMVSLEAPEIAVEGTRVLEVSAAPTGTSSNFVYSQPIAVATGQQWELSAYVTGKYPSQNPDTADVELRALWFANATDLYPTTAAADLTAATAVNILDTVPMRLISGTVTVPAGPAFMRVGLRSALSAYTSTRWDFITARRVA